MNMVYAFVFTNTDISTSTPYEICTSGDYEVLAYCRERNVADKLCRLWNNEVIRLDEDKKHDHQDS